MEKESKEKQSLFFYQWLKEQLNSRKTSKFNSKSQIEKTAFYSVQTIYRQNFFFHL